VEHALYQMTGDDALCAGGNEYENKNNHAFHDGEWYDRFHQHSWPEVFYSRIGDPTIYDDYTHITIVRNPWDTLVSYYWFCMGDLNNVYVENPQQFVVNENDTTALIKQKFEFIMTGATKYHDDPVGHELGIENDLASPFIYISMTNSRFLDDKIDRYLRHENLTHDYNQLCKDLDIDSIDLPRHKSNFRKLDLHYSEYFGDELKEEVKYYFGDYIEKFGYEFEKC